MASGRNGGISLNPSVGYSKRLLILLMIFFLALSLVGFVISLFPSLTSNTRYSLGAVSAIQDIVVFILPAVIFSFLFSSRPFRFLGISTKANSLQILGVILLFVLMTPAMNQLVYWNESVSFPASMSSIETYFRQMEDSALSSTKILLSSTTFGGFLVELFLIGILAPFSEELFFRGTVQKAIYSGRRIGPHLSIWISAIIFSAIHFQFYGFVPRMLLGAFYGYLFFWTGSIWLPFLAHALNNSAVVIITFISKAYPEYAISDDFGVVKSGLPIPAIVSAILFLIVIIGFRRQLFQNKRLK